MRISATYASRADLSPFLKRKFTLEERIGQNQYFRALWRAYRSLPQWVDDIGGICVIILAIPCLAVLEFLAGTSTFFETETHDGPSVWALYFLLAAVVCFWTWWGLLLLGLLAPFCFWLWFHTIADTTA
jgi:hypothetical protein